MWGTMRLRAPSHAMLSVQIKHMIAVQYAGLADMAVSSSKTKVDDVRGSGPRLAVGTAEKVCHPYIHSR